MKWSAEGHPSGRTCTSSHPVTTTPRTGSAVPTVVDGLVRGSATDDAAPSSVVVAQGTYPDRYPGAHVIEYPQAVARRSDRYTDAVLRGSGSPVRSPPRLRGDRPRPGLLGAVVRHRAQRASARPARRRDPAPPRPVRAQPASSDLRAP
ncbi:hypothetical protein NKG05_19790 [Oerskovia sp. M15]